MNLASSFHFPLIKLVHCYICCVNAYEMHKREISVIIVAYNNGDLNIRCNLQLHGNLITLSSPMNFMRILPDRSVFISIRFTFVYNDTDARTRTDNNRSRLSAKVVKGAQTAA